MPSSPESLDLRTLLGARFAVSLSLAEIVSAVGRALLFFLLLFFLRLILRKQWLAAAAMVTILVIADFGGFETPLVDSVFFAVAYGGVIFVLIRFGLVAYAISLFVQDMLTDYPITRHLSAWYAPSGIFAIALVAALAIYGFRTTLEGRPVFRGLLDS